MTLRARLFGAIGVTLCIVLGVLVAFTLITESHRADRMREHYDTMAAFAGGLASTLPIETPADSLLIDPAGRLHRQLTSLAVYRIDADGTPVPDRSWGEITDNAVVAERALSSVSVVVETESGIREGRAVAVPGPRLTGRPDREGRRTVVFLELRPLEIDAVAAGRVTFLVLVAAGVILLLLTWFIADRIVTRPLRAVARGAQRVAEGDYTTSVPSTGREDEIQKVVVAFNSMMDELGVLHGDLQDRIGSALRRARRTQDSLVIAQRLAATGTLAAGIAHEVNNPLGGMTNAIRALRTKQMPTERRDEYLLLVEGGLQRIEATVAKILRFTPHAVAPQPLELNDVVAPALALVRHRVEREGVDVVVELTEQANRVFGDFYELQQATLNVMLNALDALTEGDVDERRLEVRTWQQDGRVLLRIRDTGPGMSPEQLSRAFDLFYTTKEQGKGSGLGLATVHKILDDHGGGVELRPREEGGLDVLFSLPAFLD